MAQLFVKSIRNTTISIHIDSTSSISDLKHLIYVHDGIPPCDQRLLHRGRELRNDVLLSGLDVDGATITCLLRVLGGNPMKRRIPLRWWFGFSRSYADGRAGEEGRSCNVLSEFEFVSNCPRNLHSCRYQFHFMNDDSSVFCPEDWQFGDCANTHDKWYSDAPLSEWEGIRLHPGIVLICIIDQLQMTRQELQR